MNKFDYKNLTPFKWFVLENFPFIEADFDALTEWQLFCKLGKEINKIIDSQNLVGEQAETLTNAFNNLKNYVDNYFNNLDVQDEINNKLNQIDFNTNSINLTNLSNNIYNLEYLESLLEIYNNKKDNYVVINILNNQKNILNVYLNESRKIIEKLVKILEIYLKILELPEKMKEYINYLYNILNYEGDEDDGTSFNELLYTFNITLKNTYGIKKKKVKIKVLKKY